MAHQEMLAAVGIYETNARANWASSFTALEAQKRVVNAHFQPNRTTRRSLMPMLARRMSWAPESMQVGRRPA